MTATRSIVGHPARSTERNTILGSVRFTAGSSPAITSTGANGRLGVSISRSAAGKYVLTLRGSWARVSAVANLKGDSAAYAKVTAVTEGTNTCTVSINTITAPNTPTIGDPSNVEVEVLLMLTPSSRFSLS